MVTQSLISLRNFLIALPFTLLVSLLASVGCQHGPRVGVPITGCPDSTVEYLKLSKSGTIEHGDGKFMELVDRDDQKLVLVDFWATWCGPCQMLAPHLETIKKEWGDKIEVVKVDVDKAPGISAFLKVSSIPDVRVYRNGVQVADFVGVMPRADIESMLKSLE